MSRGGAGAVLRSMGKLLPQPSMLGVGFWALAAPPAWYPPVCAQAEEHRIVAAMRIIEMFEGLAVLTWISMEGGSNLVR